MHLLHRYFTQSIAFFAVEVLFFSLPSFANAQISIPQSVALVIGDTTKVFSEDQARQWFTFENRVRFDANYRPEIEVSPPCPNISEDFCLAFFSLRTRVSAHRSNSIVPDKKTLEALVIDLNEEISVKPTDAKFAMNNTGKIDVFALSKDGFRIDTQTGVDTLIAALSASHNGFVSVSLPTQIIPPAVQSSDASTLGITEMIGEGRTNFSGSPKNRVHNFKRALEQFEGILIAPNEEFSFVNLLGEVDGEHGYLPELVIKHNKTEPEFGGGICQVSSTMFRAAIQSGLKISMRRNHAYPVSYYKPYGMDATIYIPKPDLRFINNTPGHILVQSAIEGAELVIRFYGTSDGRKTHVDGPHILERKSDGSMKTIFTQTVTAADGSVLIQDDFRSNYASPSKYPHPGNEPTFTSKPSDWSEKQWSAYKKSQSG